MLVFVHNYFDVAQIIAIMLYDVEKLNEIIRCQGKPGQLMSWVLEQLDVYISGRNIDEVGYLSDPKIWYVLPRLKIQVP